MEKWSGDGFDFIISEQSLVRLNPDLEFLSTRLKHQETTSLHDRRANHEETSLQVFMLNNNREKEQLSMN